ncbi:MAG TPA: class I SAM-dependent methyltransferase, partial [Herpetosiphonaceae bacterium]
MKKVDLRRSYRDFVQSVKHQYEPDQAMHLAIGAEFDAFGVIERDLLIQYGLQPDDYVIDIGCGSGRLVKPLAHYLRGRYLGIDIVPDLVDYARSLVERPDWRFEVAEGLTIPEQDEQANIVCFFSVFTHLLHEHSFIYLR